MGNRLHNTLSFAGLVVGVPTSLPHGLNVTDVAINPDVVIPQIGGFLVTADTINVTVTRLITSPGASLNVLVTAWHSILREFGAFGPSQPAALPIQPFIVDIGASSASVAAPVTCFVFRPGGVAGANVYTTWPTLMAAVASVQGCKKILVDDSLAAAFTTAGVWSMTNVELSGDITSDGSALTVVEGTIFTGLRHISELLFLTFTGVTPPVSDFGAPFAVFVVERGARISTTGGAPFMRMTAATPLIVTFLEGGGFDPGGVVADIAVAGAVMQIQVGDLAVLGAGTVSSVVGSTFAIAPFVSSADLSESQPAVAGTQLFLNTTRARFTVVPGIVGGYAAVANDLVECDATGGGFVVTLPLAFDNRGRSVVVKKTVASANIVTVAAGGGDTVDGAASIALESPLDSCEVVSDGVANWNVVIQPLASASEPSALPEQWEQEDVAAGQVSVPLSADVSTLFDEVTVNRTGSIAGLRVRLTEAVTAGSMTVEVSINGVATTVFVVLGIGTSGAGAVSPPGFVPFVVGDLIGVLISTTAGFLPNTTDVGAWVEVAY